MKTDVLIIGSGLAGLYTALQLDPSLSVLFVTKESVGDSNSWLAQGGIAAAIGTDDMPEYHVEDTLIAGAGLCDDQAVRVLAAEGPGDIKRLVDMRVPFDLDEDGELAITREGGHTRNRIVHAGGDATGRETVRVLTTLASERSNISFMDRCFVTELILSDGVVCGAAAICGDTPLIISARFTVLATGGSGQIYHRTTNPAAATGDGIALALQAGASLKDMEFIQFHPTGLYDPQRGGRAFLISEAVRGEGAALRNKAGERFMEGQHPMAELAPRDIVSRAIVHEMQRTGEPCAYLDATAIPKARLERRFPTISEECTRRGIDISRQWIPVSPVQHYQVGGVQVDLNARTTVSGLYAVGEASCTGVHGANRLASNSMLECLVFGRRAAEDINSLPASQNDVECGGVEIAPQPPENTEAVQNRFRTVCEQYAGVIRTSEGLSQGLREIDELLSKMRTTNTRRSLETHNMALTARAVISAASQRKESVGTHFVDNGDR